MGIRTTSLATIGLLSVALAVGGCDRFYSSEPKTEPDNGSDARDVNADDEKQRGVDVNVGGKDGLDINVRGRRDGRRGKVDVDVGGKKGVNVDVDADRKPSDRDVDVDVNPDKGVDVEVDPTNDQPDERR